MKESIAKPMDGIDSTPDAQASRARAFCPICHGTGTLGYSLTEIAPCWTCKGEGVLDPLPEAPSVCRLCHGTGRQHVAGFGTIECTACVPCEPGEVRVATGEGDWLDAVSERALSWLVILLLVLVVAWVLVVVA